MNNEITVEDIIKAIDEIDDIFSEERKEENENFWCGYKYAITRIQYYITNLQQELQRKDNIINELKKYLCDDINERVFYEEYERADTLRLILDKIKELEERK